MYPAAGLINETKHGTPLYLVDPAEVGSFHLANIIHIQKGAGEGLNELVKQLMFNSSK